VMWDEFPHVVMERKRGTNEDRQHDNAGYCYTVLHIHSSGLFDRLFRDEAPAEPQCCPHDEQYLVHLHVLQIGSVVSELPKWRAIRPVRTRSYMSVLTTTTATIWCSHNAPPRRKETFPMSLCKWP
jgi:hypothetical protein